MGWTTAADRSGGFGLRSEGIHLPHWRVTTLNSAPADHRNNISWLAALTLLAGLALPLRAAAPAAPPIADSVKQAALLNQGQIKQIRDSVAAVAKNLNDSTDPAIQDADRDWLVAGASDAAKAPGSANFLDAYTQAVNDQLLSIVTGPNANLRAKIEAGVAAAKIGQVAQNTRLVPLATALLKDSSPAVVLAGMKATAATLTPIFFQRQVVEADGELLDAMLVAVARNAKPPLGGRIVEEAYNALRQPVLGTNRPKGLPNITFLVPLVMKLEEQRLPLYANDIPPSPQADSQGVVILFTQELWLGNAVGAGGLTAAQQKEALEMAASLIDASAKSASSSAAQDKSQLNDLIEALRTDGRELQIFANPNNGVNPDAALDTAAGRLAGLAPSSSIQTLTAGVSDCVTALRAMEK